jgi:hypothetical protein
MDFSPLRLKDKSIGHRNDNTALFKALGSIKIFFGLGLIASMALPRYLVPYAAAASILPSVLKALLQSFNLISNPDKRGLLKGRKCAKKKDGSSFVVFLLGAKLNHPFKLAGDAASVGKAMQEMQKELEEHPEYGCLGTENYVGSNDDGSTLLTVQYWKSADDLQKYASSSSNEHYSPWKNYLRVFKKSDDVGLWHETFIVKDANYEAVYVNCPSLHLGASRGFDIVDASRGNTTMKGRLGGGKNVEKDWPETLETLLEKDKE